MSDSNGKWEVQVKQSIKYTETLDGICDTYEEAMNICNVILKSFPETEVSISFKYSDSNRAEVVEKKMEV